MAIGDLFKRRRERESALPPGAIEELAARAAPSESVADDPEEQAREMTELPGADAAELGAMLRRAAATGLPQVSTESHTVDAAEGDLSKEILAILGSAGVGGAGGTREVDPEELRELHESVREALRRAGAPPEAPGG